MIVLLVFSFFFREGWSGKSVVEGGHTEDASLPVHSIGVRY